MIEAGLTLAIALITGGAVLTTRLHKRIDQVNGRIDSAELNVARNYISKGDFETAFRKMESHMVRIEDKLDQIMLNRYGQ